MNIRTLSSQSIPSKRTDCRIGLLTRQAETVREQLLHVPGVAKVDIVGERPERAYVNFSYARLATLGISPSDVFAALQRQNAVTAAGSIDTNGPQVYRPP